MNAVESRPMRVFHREHAGRFTNSMLEAPCNIGHSDQEEIAEGMPLQFACALEAVLEKLSHQWLNV